MKPENKAFLDQHRHVYDTLEKAGYMMGLSGPIRQGLVNVMSEEWQPGYTADLWCPPCVATMVRQVYRRYDQYLEEEAKQNAAPEPVVPPIQTKANFPSHKQNHHRK